MRASPTSLISVSDHQARAISALIRGEPIILQDHGGFIALIAVETLTPARLAAARAAFGDDCQIAITARRAETLNARVYDGDIARITVRPEQTTNHIRAIADPTLALDIPFNGPYLTARDGDPARARAAIELCRSAKLLPSALIWHSLPDWPEGLLSVTLPLTPHARDWREVISATVPIAARADTRLRLMRQVGGEDEHYVVEIGTVVRSRPVPTRLHSACATGDIFGSLKCDCGPQLASALSQIGEAGGGILIYLLQEGRGIGLANKLRAYHLQELGFDTVEANHRLGFNDDERALFDGGDILRALGVRSVRLLTNNPAKIRAVESAGIEVVDRIPLKVGLNPINREYLEVKAKKSGHLL